MWKPACHGVALWEKQVLLGVSSVNAMFSFLGMLKKGASYQAVLIKKLMLFKALRGEKKSKHPDLLKNSRIQFFDHSFLGPIFSNYFVFQRGNITQVVVNIFL